MSTQMTSSETDTIATESAQPLTNAHPTPAASLSSPVVAESVDPCTTFSGALEAKENVVVPAPQLDISAPASEATGASAEHTKKGKGVGKRFTDRQRVEILDLMDKSNGSLSNAEIARRYGVTLSAIQSLKRNGAVVRARYRCGSAETRDKRKRGSHALSVPLEWELFEWVRELKTRKVPVLPSLVREKAKLLVPKYGLVNFQASSGWYYSFCKRFSLSGVLVEEKPPSSAPAQAATASTDETSLDQSQLQQLAINALEQQSYEQQLQQYQQQMAAISAKTLQQQHSAIQGKQYKSDRLIELLEQQNTMLEQQNTMIEAQAKTIEKLFATVTQGKISL